MALDLLKCWLSTKPSDKVTCDLIDFLEKREIEVLALSEYGISKVSKSIHLNRVFRKKGWIQVKHELGLETLDCGSSKAFAVADHQVAHVYVNDASIAEEVREVVLGTDGVEEIREGCDLWGKGIGADSGRRFCSRIERRCLVYLLLLGRRFQGARLCPMHRYSPKTGIRPSGALF